MESPTQKPSNPPKQINNRNLVVFLIVALIAISVILFLLFLRQKEGNEKSSYKKSFVSNKLEVVVEKTATLSFVPESITGNAGTTQQADIIVDSGDTKITGVQMELVYDPTIISNVQVTPINDNTSFFGGVSKQLVLFNKTDTQKGTVTFAIAISPNESPRDGSGKVAHISFTVNKASSSPSKILFGENTLVTKELEKQSVLKSTTPLTIEF